MSGLCLNSMTHYIIQMGNFFGSFFSICLYFYIFFLSHLVMDLDIIAIRCWEWIFSAPATFFFFLCMFCFVTAFNSALIGLFQCSTTNWPVWICLPNLTYPGKSTRAKSFFFLLPKKYTRTSPFPFFSPFLSRLLFLDCFTICCSECL